ncbi:hypothetical protein BDV19DRAFT_392987 [Aspergillus venezuelensis]
MPLIALLCTAKVPPATLSSNLTRAYEASKAINSPPNLVLLTSSNTDELRGYTPDSITIPPIDGHTEYPFLGWTITQLASFLDRIKAITVLESSTFLVADQQTVSDGDTILLVHNIHVQESLNSVRVSAEYANSEAVAVSVASKDVVEWRSLVDGDGVYRGGRTSRGDGGKEVKKGRRAPRKKLGS